MARRKSAAEIGLEVDGLLAAARATWGRTGKPAANPVEPTDEERKKSGKCTYCGGPTRKGSALVDGWPAHKSCIAEYED